MSRFTRGWEIGKQSFSIIRANKKLLIYPLISIIVCMFLLLLIAMPLWHLELNHWQTGQSNFSKNLIVILLFLGILYLCNFVIAFCNAAFMASIMAYFDQRPATVAEGFRVAKSRFWAIMGWSFISSTFGATIRLVGSRLNNLAFVAAIFAGITWTIISYFVIPVIILEKIGPIKAIKRSSQWLQKTWGTSLTANFNLGILFLIPRLLVLLPLLIGFYLPSTNAALLGSSITAILLILLYMFSNGLHNILRCVLYHYATTGKSPPSCNPALLQTAFRTRSPMKN
ncbi:hypothetical protein CbuD7D7780_06655 [Coxiella burnetii]|uniref:Hypothetical membrane spanning protein n=1 Tax=Coxiella burnetii (strain Dugway 5J108-111) TaxID=434922 RepID=A9KFQ5_COXBN|nr:DUF6159 family protein [Coxiella burnetii]ABS77987.1 hypothetical membrane spanning protein [Coxiella burnetii Dugway 5J108-111]OYK80059.1 hypothetical protein CbuD7E6568_06625 [Coxiella burnetii]OYK82140.1 hypothetical protein CbuD7D7780_06655 [Coxiella burnetii]